MEPHERKKERGQFPPLLTAFSSFARTSHMAPAQFEREDGKGTEAQVTYDKYHLYCVIIFPSISKINCCLWVSVLNLPLVK